MMYFYEKPDDWERGSALVVKSNHPLYNKCTLYMSDDIFRFVAIVQQRFNPVMKTTWWGPVDPWLADDITHQRGWCDWLEEHALEADKDGLYPTYTIRKVMWALRMKPLRREIWEDSRILQGL